jgi:hypothetical protein
MRRIILLTFIWCISLYAYAGVDITGKIERVWLRSDGTLWFKLNNALVDTYCKPGWFGFNLYIKESDSNFPYYYGLVTSANANGQSVRISNISIFDGATSCDVIQTGFGIVVHSLP